MKKLAILIFNLFITQISFAQSIEFLGGIGSYQCSGPISDINGDSPDTYNLESAVIELIGMQ